MGGCELTAGGPSLWLLASRPETRRLASDFGPGLHGLDVELISSFWGPHSGSGLQVGSGI